MEAKKELDQFQACKSAADSGDANAQVQLGMYYRQNNKIYEGMEYLIKAAHNGNTQAQGIITYVSNASLAQESQSAFYTLSEEEQEQKVRELIKTKISPMLARDGGGIELINYISGANPQIWLSYVGACSGCHLGSTSTADMLLHQFEEMIDKNVILYLM